MDTQLPLSVHNRNALPSWSKRLLDGQAVLGRSGQLHADGVELPHARVAKAPLNVGLGSEAAINVLDEGVDGRQIGSPLQDLQCFFHSDWLNHTFQLEWP